MPGEQCGDVVFVTDAVLGGTPRGPAAVRKDLGHVRVRRHHRCMFPDAAGGRVTTAHPGSKGNTQVTTEKEANVSRTDRWAAGSLYALCCTAHSEATTSMRRAFRGRV